MPLVPGKSRRPLLLGLQDTVHVDVWFLLAVPAVSPVGASKVSPFFGKRNHGDVLSTRSKSQPFVECNSAQAYLPCSCFTHLGDGICTTTDLPISPHRVEM